MKNLVIAFIHFTLDMDRKETKSPNGSARTKVAANKISVLPSQLKSLTNISKNSCILNYAAGKISLLMVVLITSSPAEEPSATNFASFMLA